MKANRSLRDEPPPGYQVEYVCRDVEGNRIDEWQAERDELAECWHIPSVPMNPQMTEEEAVAECWAHRDSIVAEVERERDEWREIAEQMERDCSPDGVWAKLDNLARRVVKGAESYDELKARVERLAGIGEQIMGAWALNSRDDMRVALDELSKAIDWPTTVRRLAAAAREREAAEDAALADAPEQKDELPK